MIYNKRDLTIIIPCRNEGEGIARILSSVKPFTDNIIVIDGHSSDNTKNIAKKMGVKFVLDHGLGRGDAVRMGIKLSKTPVTLFFDADGSHESKDIPKLIKPLFESEADLVVASRKLGGSYDLAVNFTGVIRTTGSDLMVALVNHKFKDKGITEILYSFRAIKTDIAKDLKLKSNGFTIEQEMVIKALKKGYRVIEIPSREKARGWGVSKLRTIAGIKLFYYLVRELYF